MEVPAAYLTRRAIIKEVADRTSVIKIASWTLLGIMIATVLARQVMKLVLKRRLASDDFFISLGTVSYPANLTLMADRLKIFTIGLFVTTYILASDGLGALHILDFEHAETLMKGYYACELLYICSICFAKLSVLVIFYDVMETTRLHRQHIVGFVSFILVWSVASLLAVAFQCPLPRPWELVDLRCFDTVSNEVIFLTDSKRLTEASATSGLYTVLSICLPKSQSSCSQYVSPQPSMVGSPARLLQFYALRHECWLSVQPSFA
jgi:hypothetical protein